MKRTLPGFFLGCLLTFALAGSIMAAPRLTLSQHHVPDVVATLQPIGQLPSSNVLTLTIGLPLRNEEGLSNLLDQLQDPASANYHHYLTPAQFADKFGATQQDYQALIGFAETNGLTLKHTHANRLLITVSGTVAQIEQAFHVTLRVYQHPTEGRTFYAPDVEPTLDFEVPVLDIGGLDNYLLPKPMSLHVKSMASPNASPATGSGPSGTFIGNDFRAAYIPGVSLTGTGQIVGLIEFDAYYAADIVNYENLAHLPAVTLTNITPDGIINPGNGNIEVALDIEMAMSLAPGLAMIAVYEGTTTDDVISAAANNPIANQISTSWSYPVDSTTVNLFKQFQTQGQTFFNASGDSGAYTKTSNPVPSPTDDPYITIVGGTTLTTTGPGGAYVSETTWNWNTSGGGTNASSGGSSRSFFIPTWQQGFTGGTNGASSTYRNLPDVALTADNIWVDFNNGSGTIVGGTSAATPLWAAFTALANEQAQQNGLTNAGFINNTVYSIAKSASYLTDFHDITNGNNTNHFSSTKYFATTNYDLCTGLGTPNGAAMISALAGGSILVLAQPTNEITAPGSNATFSVNAVGTAMSYQWKFDGTNILNATNSSYAITNAQTTNQGTYAVSITNSVSSVLSSNVTLTVNAGVDITGPPQSLTVPQGANATFNVTATGSPPPTYQWQFNGTNIAMATNTSYTVTNAQYTNQGNYSVFVSNPGGGMLAFATLTVDAPPYITTQPTSHTVSQGASPGFVCNASGSTPLSFQWYFNGSIIPNATNTLYVVSNAQLANQGNYYAVVTNAFGSTNSSIAVLTVNAPPTITAQPQGSSFAVGNVASFSANATGSTPLAFQWYFNSTPLADNSRIVGSQTANLVISNVLVSDAGNYRLLVTNAYGSTNSLTVALSVTKATPSLTWTNPTMLVYGAALTPNQLNASASQPGNFAYNPPAGTVLSAGTNSLSVNFTPSDTNDYNNVTDSVSIVISPTPLTVTASNATRLYGQPNPTFGVSIVGATNGDVFTASGICSATSTNLPGTYPIVPSVNDPSNRLGNYNVTLVNGTLTITPAAPPLITTIVPNTGSTNGGDSVSIIGTNFENGATIYFGALLAASINVTNATNILVTTPAEKTGTVDVIITNADGQSFVFTNSFTYAQPAQLVSGPTNLAVPIGGSANFTASAIGTLPLDFQWFFQMTALPGATNGNLVLSNVQAANAGNYEVIVSNAYGASTSSVASLSVLGTPVSFLTPARLANGQFLLQLTGLTGQGPVVIQSSSNLMTWNSIFTNPPGFGQVQFTDTNAANSPRQFYRAITPAAE